MRDNTGAYVLIFLGLFLLAGFFAHVLGRRVHVPRVTLLLLLGFLAGPSALDIVPEGAAAWFPLAAKFALSIIDSRSTGRANCSRVGNDRSSKSSVREASDGKSSGLAGI